MIKYTPVLFLLVACNPLKPRYRVDIETIVPPRCAPQFSAVMIECANAANPLSDEEGEDLVHQCQISAEAAWGADRPYLVNVENCDDKKPCDERCTDTLALFEARTAALEELCLELSVSP